MPDRSRIAVLGGGSWGTALAHHLARAKHDVTLWARDADLLKYIEQHHRNPRHLTTETLHRDIKTAAKLSDAVTGKQLVIVAVPSAAVRELAVSLKSSLATDALVVSTAKGLEEGTLKSMSEVLAEVVQDGSRIAVLSGPSFAIEVVQGKPTAVTVAAREESVSQQVSTAFHADNFRVYTSGDVVGVEFGGVLKNVMAIACGVVDGVNIGANARAALLTRGLSEMQRFVVAVGGDPLTVAGLSGLGDLLLTATGDLSRNRQVGMRLARGEKLVEIVASLGEVAEGVRTTHNVVELAKRLQLSMPITEQVNKLLLGECNATESVAALLMRSPGSEIKLK